MKYIGFGSSKVFGVRALTFHLFTFLLFMACTLSGCIEEFEADIPVDESDLLVVEGTICSGKLSTFSLSRTQPLNVSYAPPQWVKGAVVSVRGSDGSEYRAREADDCYSCEVGNLSPDEEYYLHIEIGGEVYESEPQKPLRTEKIADVSGVQSTPKSNIDVVLTTDAPFDSAEVNYYSWTYEETWEVYADYTTHIYFDRRQLAPFPLEEGVSLFPDHGWKDGASSEAIIGSSVNYEGQHIQRLKLYDISQSGERIYHRYSGLIHQRAISKAEYEYELARRQADSEMGGLFSPQPSSLPTNIRCLTSGKHAIGFVGCSLNTSDYRFFLNSTDFQVTNPHGADLLWLELEGLSDTEYKKFLEKCRQLAYTMYLCEWIDERDTPGGKLRTAWAYEYQLDVRYKGAYLEKPDFW